MVGLAQVLPFPRSHPTFVGSAEYSWDVVAAAVDHQDRVVGLPSLKLQVGEGTGLDWRSHCVDLRQTLREVRRKTLTLVCEFARVPR